MRPDDILHWLRAQPFRPFRITMNSGRSYEIRHPEIVRVLRTSLIIFTPTEKEEVYETGDMIGLVLIERIEPLNPPADASPAAQPSSDAEQS
jgi:hypothetical protein